MIRVTHEQRPAGGWLPHGARYQKEREDQGQDMITDWRGPIIAPGDGEVVAILSDRPFPDGFGHRYAVVRITTGRFAGHDWYVGHATATVNLHEHFKDGHRLALADQGHVQGGGWVEIGEAPGGVPGPMGTGQKWAHLFGPVEITTQHRVSINPRGKKPPTHKPPPHKHLKPPERKTKPGEPRKRPSEPRRSPGAHSPGRAPARRSPPPPRPAGGRSAPRPAPPPPPRRAPPAPKRRR